MRALREMAVAQGYADGSLIDEVEELDQLSQKLRRDMVNALVTDRGKFDKMKENVEKMIG